MLYDTFLAKSLQIEVVKSTNLLLKPLICQKSHAITSKCHNSKDTNFNIRAKDILQTLRQPPEDLQFHEIVVPVCELKKEQEQEILVDESKALKIRYTLMDFYLVDMHWLS